MTRRLHQARELELRVEHGMFSGVRREGLFVTAAKRLKNLRAPAIFVHDDETPRLAVADTRCQARQFQQFRDNPAIDWVGAKPPDVAPPDQELTELAAQLIR